MDGQEAIPIVASYDKNIKKVELVLGIRCSSVGQNGKIEFFFFGINGSFMFANQRKPYSFSKGKGLVYLFVVAHRK